MNATSASAARPTSTRVSGGSRLSGQAERRHRSGCRAAARCRCDRAALRSPSGSGIDCTSGTTTKARGARTRRSRSAGCVPASRDHAREASEPDEARHQEGDHRAPVNAADQERRGGHDRRGRRHVPARGQRLGADGDAGGGPNAARLPTSRWLRSGLGGGARRQKTRSSTTRTSPGRTITLGERPSLMSATGKTWISILPRDLATQVHRVLGSDAGESAGVRDGVDDRHVRVVADLARLRDLAENGDLLAVPILDRDDDLRILEILVLELVDEQLLDLAGPQTRRPEAGRPVGSRRFRRSRPETCPRDRFRRRPERRRCRRSPTRSSGAPTSSLTVETCLGAGIARPEARAGHRQRQPARPDDTTHDIGPLD